MKPFDIEAAKRGEPITSSDGKLWYFVGVTRSWAIVVENRNGDLSAFQACHLYMTPKKRTVWVNFYSNGEAYYHYTQKEADDVDAETCHERKGGKAYPVEIEE
jgi:hypothetical protein